MTIIQNKPKSTLLISECQRTSSPPSLPSPPCHTSPHGVVECVRTELPECVLCAADGVDVPEAAETQLHRRGRGLPAPAVQLGDMVVG